MIYDESDIASQLGEETLEAGRLCQQQGGVLEYSHAGVLVTAAVRASGKDPFRQKITTAGSKADKVSIHGVCSCAKGLGCEHIAAVLLEGLVRQAAQKAADEAAAAAKAAAGKSAAARQPAVRPAARSAAADNRPGFTPAVPTATSEPTIAAASGLPASLDAWLGGLVHAGAADTGADAGAGSERLVYVLKPERSSRDSIPSLKLALVRARRRDGALFLSRDRLDNFRTAPREATAKEFLCSSDISILDRIAMIINYNVSHYSPCDDVFRYDESSILLELILATGRACWGLVEGPVTPLALAPARQGRIVWVESEDGSATRIAVEAGEGNICLSAFRVLYVDPERGLIGPLELPVAHKIVAALVAVPPFAVEHAALLVQHMVGELPALASLLPPPPRPPVLQREKPGVTLRLLTARFPVIHSGFFYDYHDESEDVERETVALARITFRYGSAMVELDDERKVIDALCDGIAVKIRRDDEAEAQARERLRSMGLTTVSPFVNATGYGKDYLADAYPIKPFWLDLLYRGLPRLSKRGWTIEIDDDFPFQLLPEAGALDVGIVENAQADWLDLDVGVRIGDEVVDLVPSIVAMIGADDFDPSRFIGSESENSEEGDRESNNLANKLANKESDGKGGEDGSVVFLPVGAGRFLALSKRQIAPIIAMIWELSLCGAGGGARPVLSMMDLAALAAFEEAMRRQGMQLRAGGKLREMGRRLSASGGFPPVAIPADFTASLRPYQAEGVAWLALLDELRIGGVLADDMGLGKTVQALALIAVAKEAGRLETPALIIAPTSLMTNWRREAAKFAPALSVLVLQGADRKERFGAIGSADIVLSTYPLLARDQAILSAQKWSLIFLDEAQTIKNPRAETTRMARALKGRTRFCLTGTPLENHLGELWSLFSFAVPGLLGDHKSFTSSFRGPIEKTGDAGRSRLLARRVKPFLLRRTKDDVASELPPKVEIIERIEFEPAQRRVYESIRLAMHEKVRAAIAAKGFGKSSFVILQALLQLRQCCCDPRLLRLSDESAAKAGSAKLERVMAMLEELIEQDRRVLVFSQFVSMLELIADELTIRAIDFALLTGDTRDRAAEIDAFQGGKKSVFLLSLKVGGVGLNLTAADTVILYDPWWNPAVEDQAVDRAHRIGQDRHVFVHQLVVAGTIEEKMLPLKEKKRALAETVFDREGGSALGIGEEELNMLFEAD